MEPEIKYMKAALREARKAEKLEEVPIGCVIVQNDKIIARGYNRRNTDKNTLSHAELTAIKKASKKTGDWRLEVAAFNHQVEIERGVLEEECSDMLSEFFRRLREKKKQQKMMAKP